MAGKHSVIDALLSKRSGLYKDHSAKKAELKRARGTGTRLAELESGLAVLRAAVNEQRAIKSLGREHQLEAALESLGKAEADASAQIADDSASDLAVSIVERELGVIELNIAKLERDLHHAVVEFALAAPLARLSEREHQARIEAKRVESELMALYAVATQVAPYAAIGLIEHFNNRIDHRNLDHDQIRTFTARILEDLREQGLYVEGHQSKDRDFDAGRGRSLMRSAVGMDASPVQAAVPSATKDVTPAPSITFSEQSGVVVQEAEGGAPLWDGPSRTVVDHSGDWAPGRVA